MGSKTIGIIVAAGGTALVVGLVIGAFATAGVIDMPAAIGMLVLAWIVGTVAIFTSDYFRKKSRWRPKGSKILASCGLAISLFLIGIYINAHRPHDESASHFAKMTYAALGGYPTQMHFTNSGTSAALGLAFKGVPDLAYDKELTEAQEDERIRSLKRSLQSERSSRGDSETQPSESVRFELDDPSGLAMKGSTIDTKTIFYIFSVLEYRDTIIPAAKWWITELCMMAEPKTAMHKCARHNKIYLSD